MSPARRHLLPALALSGRRIVLAVAILFGSSAVFTLAIPAQTFAWSTGTYDASSEAQLVALTNRSRTNAGLKALKVDSTLRTVARWRSKDMIDRDYFGHDIPGYGKVFDKLDAIGYCYKIAGENIGWNNYPDNAATAQIQSMFMASAPHRSNILGKAWDVMAVGAYKGPGGKKMWTVLFADKCGSTAPAPTPRPQPKPTPKPQPAPTPRPRATVAPTVTPTAEPTPVATSEPTSALPSDIVEPDPTAGATSGPPASSDPGNDPSGPTGAVGAVGLRVVDRGSPQGLLDTIVGDVTGFFFGD